MAMPGVLRKESEREKKDKQGKSVEENRLLLKLLSWPTLASSESTEVSFLGISAYL